MLALIALALGWPTPVIAAFHAGSATPIPMAPPASPEAPRIERVWLDVEASLQPSLREALSLRLSPVPITDHDASRPSNGEGNGLHVYVFVPEPRDERYDVEIIVSDGRAYTRRIAAPAAMAGRILGSELALLLRGIEEGTIVPDRQDARMPGTDTGGSTSDDEPVGPVPPKPSPAVIDSRSARTEPRLELGVIAAMGGLLGIAPTADIGRSVAVLGELGMEVRWPSGAAVSADIRMGGRHTSPFSLLRTRIAVGGGYVLRRGAFELPLRMWLGVEPWGVRVHGRGTPVVPLHGNARQVPLLGLVARADPGIRMSFATRPSLAMRLGPYVELAGSAAWSDGVGVPRLRAADTGEVVARLGGLELGLGLSVQLWLAMGQAASRVRSERAPP
jgi:hypothetical protein